MQSLWGSRGRRPSQLATVTIGDSSAEVDRRAASAFRTLAAILGRHGYRARSAGGYNDRDIAGTTTPSMHAYGLAVDVDPDINPDGSTLRTALPTAAVAEIVGLRTPGGDRVFRWGGDWDDDARTPHTYYDAMHFEIQASPGELGSFQDVEWPQSDMMKVPTPETIRRGAKGTSVVAVQGTVGVAADGIFGERTEAAVRNWQRRHRLAIDGIVGPDTWAAIVTTW